MRRNDIVLIANAGHNIPTVLSEKALTDFPDALGVIYLEENGISPGADKATPSLEDFEGHQTEFQSTTRIYSLSQIKGDTVKDEELQPLIILKQDDDPIVVAFWSGEFDVTNDGQLPSALIMADEHLKPLFEDAWKLCDQNVDKLWERMAGKPFENQMKLLCSPFKSTLVFMLSNGKHHVYSYSETKALTDWGFTSSMLGLKEGIFPAKAVEPEKKKLGGIKPKESSSEPKMPDGVHKVPDKTVTQVGATSVIQNGPTAHDLVGKTEAATFVQAEMCWAVPKAGMKENKIHDWYYKLNNGKIPTNLKDRPPIQMVKEKALRMGSVTIITDEAYQKWQKDHAAKSASPAPVVVAAKEEPKVAPAVAKTSVPLTSVELAKRVEATLQNSKEVVDPATWEKLETKNPTFWARFGITPEKDWQISQITREVVAQIDPKAAAQAWGNWAYKCFVMEQELKRVNAILESQTAPSTVTAEQPKKKIGGIRR